MDEDLIVARDAELIETEIDGEMVALDVEKGTCLGFNATASRIWSMIAQPLPLRELLARLAEEFDVDPAECRRDVGSLLSDLSDQGLVRFERPARG